MHIRVEPIAFVHALRKSPEDDFWGGEIAALRLVDSIDASALAGVDAFSHVEVLFLFHQVAENKIVSDARHPRNNTAWPKVGIFAQREPLLWLLRVNGMVLGQTASPSRADGASA